MTDSDRDSMRTFVYRLRPTRAQHEALARIREDQRQLYNAALQERIDCYRRTGRSITYQDQCRSLTKIRAWHDGLGAVPANLSRATLQQLDRAFSAFFRRVRSGASRAGFPRFRSRERWASFGFAEFSGISFGGERVRFVGMPGSLRVRMSRALPVGAKITCCRLTADAKGWRVAFFVRFVGPALPVHTGGSVGLDVGVNALAVLSGGERIENVRPSRSAHALLRRRQRALARCKKGSASRRKARRQLARVQARIANARRTYLHQVSANLTKRFSLIAVEALNVKGLARGILARDVHDASWGQLRQMLTYKAESAGGKVVAVDPKFTSQDCSASGARVPKPLSVRVHECACGLTLDRDHNAALNILHRAVVGPGTHNVAGCGVRAARTISGGIQ